MTDRQLILRLTKKDFEVQVFRAGGKGGQHQNKTNSAVRIIHRASGAVGEARDNRSQGQNKKSAFLRMMETAEFKNWLRIATGHALVAGGNVGLEYEMPPPPGDLLVERRINGRWQRWDGRD